jgi:hypothetical protein
MHSILLKNPDIHFKEYPYNRNQQSFMFLFVIPIFI